MKKHFSILFALVLAMALVFAANAVTEWNTSNTVEVYRNTFDNEDSLSEFTSYNGDWQVKNGQLYLTRSNGTNHPFIIYTGDESLTKLTDYVVDVDMLNVRTQGGVIIRSDTEWVTATSNGFAGYFAFISFDGTKGALAFGNKNGSYGGNLEVSPKITSPLSNLHLQVIARGDQIHYTVTSLESGKILWEHTETHNTWSQGTFGFRMYARSYNGLTNIGTTSFDNLVVSAFSEEKPEENNGMCIPELDGIELDREEIKKSASRILPALWFAKMFGADVSIDIASGTINIKMSTDDAYGDIFGDIFGGLYESDDTTESLPNIEY